MVRLHASAVDPEVMSETGETIAVSGSLGHTSFANKKNYEQSNKTKINKTLPRTTISICHTQPLRHPHKSKTGQQSITDTLV